MAAIILGGYLTFFNIYICSLWSLAAAVQAVTNPIAAGNSSAHFQSSSAAGAGLMTVATSIQTSGGSSGCKTCPYASSEHDGRCMRTGINLGSFVLYEKEIAE